MPGDSEREIVVSALKILENAVCNLLALHPEGLRNSAIAQALGLESDHEGKQRDYLTYSVLGLLMKDGRVQKSHRDGEVFYAVRR